MRKMIRSAIQKLDRKRIEWREHYGRMTADARSLPAFIIGGAMKSGTTTLYDLLGQHPQVMRATRKEVHFFDAQYDRGIAFYKSHFPKESSLHRRGAITGESSPSYLFLADAVAPRIRHDIPGVKLIFLLRNPVDRAFSHYNHDKIRGRLGGKSFADVMEQELADPLNYLKRGHYAEQLGHFFKHFPKDQILIFNSDDFNESMPKVVARTFRFLNLTVAVPITYGKSHVGGYHDQITPSMRQRLQEYYQPLNRDLESLTGIKFNW